MHAGDIPRGRYGAGADDRSKPDPDRLKGMKAAVSDVEKGVLKLIVPPTPSPVWEFEYHKLIKKECGVEVMVGGFDAKEGSEKANGGYNAVMLAEIEHRFGAGILEKLQKRAEKDHNASHSKGGHDGPGLLDLPFDLSAKTAQDVKVLKRWSPTSTCGKHNDLWRLAPQGGVITGPKEWAALWKAWYGDADVPEVDFDKEIILVAAGSGPNILTVEDLTLSEKGELKFGWSITQRGGNGFVGVILKVSRDGVRSVNGKRLPKQ